MMESSHNKSQEEVKDLQKTDKERFLESVKAEKLKKLYHFPVQDDSEKKVSSSTKFFLYLTEENNLYVNYQNGSTVVYEPTPYQLFLVDWLEMARNKKEEAEDGSVISAMLADPAAKITPASSSKADEASAVLILQNQETHKVRMFSFVCDQKEMTALKIIPTVPLIEDETAVSD